MTKDEKNEGGKIEVGNSGVERSTYYTYYYLPAYYNYTPAVYSEYYRYVPPYYNYTAAYYDYIYYYGKYIAYFTGYAGWWAGGGEDGDPAGLVIKMNGVTYCRYGVYTLYEYGPFDKMIVFMSYHRSSSTWGVITGFCDNGYRFYDQRNKTAYTNRVWYFLTGADSTALHRQPESYVYIAATYYYKSIIIQNESYQYKAAIYSNPVHYTYTEV